MQPSWASFEDKVRAVASYIWNGDCRPANVGGVDLDGVMVLSDDAQIFIEMTEERDLNKVRADVIKLQTARAAYLQEKQSYPRCYCVVNGSITKGMKDAGTPHRINVLSFGEFAAIFFDFEKYRSARDTATFGSAINTLTGTRDDREYIPVTYLTDGGNKAIGLAEIAQMLQAGKRLVLLGEYGTGKSRCYRELFKLLATLASNKNLYPLALNLREYWGLRRGPELIMRHIAELGLDHSLQSATIRAFNAQRTILLLDGFDELGSQSWSNDSEKMRAIRAKSLEGIKDLLTRSQAGALISGREHYFNSNGEMFSALGLDSSKTTILRCKEEFSETEMRNFFAKIAVDVALPDWLPRRPLICQTIADMDPDDLDQVFGVGEDELSFWDHFIGILCAREARIHVSFDAKTIETVLTYLARLTRSRAANVGPITLADVHAAFESVVGQMPIEEASVMLQRLPALGRSG
jgi:NACHT domain